MSDKLRAASAYTDSKPHYDILNGLRGVAAIMVIFYHVFEAFATSPADQHFNHAYLAVDFFFALSGFVIGYAYDNRWSSMKTKDFFKRRIIRLHPMVIMGAVLGLIAFLIQGSVQWDGTKVSLSMAMFALLLTMFFIPAVPGTGMEVRGNGEIFPLNGPSWSLFFEYIANIFYALLIRRMSTKALTAMVVISGAGLAAFAVGGLSGYSHLGVGWSLLDYNFLGGMLRITFSFSVGLLLSRKFKPMQVKGAFWKASLVIVVLLSVPYLGGENTRWINGIYDSVLVIFIFPFLVLLGASGKITSNNTMHLNKFLGDISYPIYMIHYPFMYLFYAWVWKHEYTFAQTWPVALLLVIGNIVLAWLILKFYDMPLRKYLSRRFLSN
jgi:peptidoglycan/LPS O-acetylase OafA/YrhL